jgi:AcrR family transcriptional regulator
MPSKPHKRVPVSPSARPGRPRQPDLDRRIEEAVLDLLRESGPAAVTMESVAAQAGIAKTSIYRRHANRGELMTSVLKAAIEPPQVPHEGTVREKIRIALGQAWRQMTDVLGPGGLAAIVGNSDPEFTGLFRAALRPYDKALVARIRDDAEAGRLRPDLDADGVVSLMFGAYLGELVRRGRVTSGWLDRSMEMIWLVMTSPDTHRPPEGGPAE